jgi:hypothetical protein
LFKGGDDLEKRISAALATGTGPIGVSAAVAGVFLVVAYFIS